MSAKDGLDPAEAPGAGPQATAAPSRSTSRPSSQSSSSQSSSSQSSSSQSSSSSRSTSAQDTPSGGGAKTANIARRSAGFRPRGKRGYLSMLRSATGAGDDKTEREIASSERERWAREHAGDLEDRRRNEARRKFGGQDP